MKRLLFALTMICGSAAIFAEPTASKAGHYEWRTQGLRSGWYYVPDESDYSQVWTPPSPVTQQPVGPSLGTTAPADPVPDFRISDAGRVYEGRTYLGMAKHGKFKSGRSGWSFHIPNGWHVYRYDGESRTRKNL